MKVTIDWDVGGGFLGRSDDGHEVLMDAPPEGGGQNRGPRPMEMLLMGMGACSCYDVISILKKSRQALHSCKISVTAKRAQEVPKVFTKIHLHFVLVGNEIKEKAVQRAIQLSAEKYCSASIMLGATATVTHGYEICASSPESAETGP